ncbi:MAG TPA: hypothetical protein VK208_05675 [Pyrinomonadaceae bacterium]|nr:hypothetical protein [Pyrinomonadaceae bacterium]
MTNRLLIVFASAALAAGSAGCSTTDNANANGNANIALASSTPADTTRLGPDGSEITTSVDANGVKTETRVFHNNPRVAKVVVTTRDGKQTTTVYAPNGDSRDLKGDVGDALSATGNALADAAGFVAARTGDAVNATKEGVKTVGEKTGEAAQTVGEKTAEGAKKTGKAIKKAVTP